ncbi:MAG: dipeptide/oligopeptide/nickel ABC transporter ATP-binding protein [Actinomycetia bacterium]|nr:dipeptide/oligopeptide/nickel ABC transporter ATP-binding protein [Actinomycetes bacterium]
MLYEVDQVSRWYGAPGRPGSVLAVDRVSLSVERGERLGIVGESGSGKSTLVRMMIALDRPTGGEIRFQGQPVSGRREQDLAELRSSVQLVFQDPRSSLNPRMRVGQIITEPLRSPLLRRRGHIPADPRARLAEVTEAVGLPSDAVDRYPHEFSGGQRQRIAIARALAPEPDVLIADEPVSALDVSVRAQVLNLLTELVRDQGLTLVMVSHDLSVVRHVCDTVAVMRRGALVEHGPAARVYEAPQSDYTTELLAAVPRFGTGSLRAGGSR